MMRIRLLDASEFDGLEFDVPLSTNDFYLPELNVVGIALTDVLKTPEKLQNITPKNRHYQRYPRERLTRRQVEEAPTEVHIFIHEQMVKNLRNLKGNA